MPVSNFNLMNEDEKRGRSIPVSDFEKLVVLAKYSGPTLTPTGSLHVALA